MVVYQTTMIDSHPVCGTCDDLRAYISTSSYHRGTQDIQICLAHSLLIALVIFDIVQLVFNKSNMILNFKLLKISGGRTAISYLFVPPLAFKHLTAIMVLAISLDISAPWRTVLPSSTPTFRFSSFVYKNVCTRQCVYKNVVYKNVMVLAISLDISAPWRTVLPSSTPTFRFSSFVYKNVCTWPSAPWRTVLPSSTPTFRFSSFVYKNVCTRQ